MQRLKYFGANRMAAMQAKYQDRQNKDLVKYRPTWGLGPESAMGSHNEGWNPEIGMKKESEQTVQVGDKYDKKRVPFSQAAGLYWTGTNMQQLDPAKLMNDPNASSVSQGGNASLDDPKRDKASSEMMKGFKMLHKASPELQSMAPISDWDDVSPNMIKGIMSGLELMGSAQDLGAKRKGAEQEDVNQGAMRSALSAGKEPLAMMKAYADAGGADMGEMKSMQDILEGPWKPQVGKMGDKEYMMTSPRSAVWDKSEAESDLKIPYQGPVLKRDGVTFLWSDKDKSYKGSTPKEESPTDQYLRMKLGLPGGKQPKDTSKSYGKWSLE